QCLSRLTYYSFLHSFSLLHCLRFFFHFIFFFKASSPSEIYTLSLHDALPIFNVLPISNLWVRNMAFQSYDKLDISQVLQPTPIRSEEHTSELQSRFDLVCRLLLEKKKKQKTKHQHTQEKKANRKKAHDSIHIE